MISFRVYGVPAPQGSKRHVGGGRMIESSKKVGPWRAAVIAAAISARLAGGPHEIAGAVSVDITFYRARPGSHYNSKKQLKPHAPDYPNTTPDLDKLVRSTFDALTDSGVITDDARVVELYATKVFTEKTAGADIVIRSMSEGKTE